MEIEKKKCQEESKHSKESIITWNESSDSIISNSFNASIYLFPRYSFTEEEEDCCFSLIDLSKKKNSKGQREMEKMEA